MNPAGSCRLCANPLSRLVSKRDAKSRKSLLVYMCETCGLVQQSPMPTEHELRIYYSHHYRTDYKNSYSPKPKYVFRAGRAAKYRIQSLTDFLKATYRDVTGLSMLDVGAGGGEVVFAANQAGIRACGIEPNEGYSDFASDAYGIKVVTAHLDEIEQQQYSVVTMFHVLEHMPNPRKVFKKLFQLIEAHGFLVVEVPNIEQADASPANIFFKAHLYYYSLSTLISAASEAFEPVVTGDIGNLTVIFRRRACLTEVHLPDAASVERTKVRLRQKGWLEYLTEGGGWKRPFERASNRYREYKNSSATPLTTLRKALELT